MIIYDKICPILELYDAAYQRLTCYHNHASVHVQPYDWDKETQMGQIDETIVSAAIYPVIGIARVGNSRDEYFIGPEVTPHETSGRLL